MALQKVNEIDDSGIYEDVQELMDVNYYTRSLLYPDTEEDDISGQFK